MTSLLTLCKCSVSILANGLTFQVIRYNEKQHYHCHYDSEDEEAKETPCCHHAENLVEVDEYEDDNIKCVPCR